MEPIEPLIPPDYFPGVVYSLAAAFFSFSAVSALYAVFWWLRDPKFSLVKLIFSLLPVSTAARGVVLAVSNPLHYLTRQLQQQSTSEFVLGSMPGYLMISIYLLLSLFWLVLSYKARKQDPAVLDNLKFVYVLANIFMYLGWLSLVISFSILKSQGEDTAANIAHSVEAVYATTLSLFVAFSSVWYGYTVYSALAALPIISERRNRMARKVAFLAVAMFVIFLIRSLNIILSFWAFKAELQLFLLSSIGLVLSELVPSYVLFALLLPEPKRKPIMPVGQEVMDYGSTPSHSYH